jgi:hypothetical protein
VPPELFNEHPEYFPLIYGKRTNSAGGKQYVQRCLSNPDVLRIATDRVRQWSQEHPEATVTCGSACKWPGCRSGT